MYDGNASGNNKAHSIIFFIKKSYRHINQARPTPKINVVKPTPNIRRKVLYK